MYCSLRYLDLSTRPVLCGSINEKHVPQFRPLPTSSKPISGAEHLGPTLTREQGPRGLHGEPHIHLLGMSSDYFLAVIRIHKQSPSSLTECPIHSIATWLATGQTSRALREWQGSDRSVDWRRDRCSTRQSLGRMITGRTVRKHLIVGNENAVVQSVRIQWVASAALGRFLDGYHEATHHSGRSWGERGTAGSLSKGCGEGHFAMTARKRHGRALK